MKVYISVDAEGISGVFKLSQVIPGSQDYATVRDLMIGDVNAAVRGAFKAGATEVLVNDAHNAGDNLPILKLDKRARLLSGSNRPLSMAEGVERGFDAMLLIGYHAKKGMRGVIAHTFFYSALFEVKINGRPVSEYDLVGLAGGHFGMPLVFLSGDDCVTKDAKQTVPGLYTVETKECVGNNAALCVHPDITTEQIEKTVEQALRNYKTIAPMTCKLPVDIDITFSAESQAALAMNVEGAQRLNDNTVRVSAADYLTAYKKYLNAIQIASNFRDQA